MGIQASIIFEEQIGNGSSRIPIGVHTKVSFNGLIRDAEYYDISFTKDGYGIAKRLFKPTGAQPLEGETPSQAKAREEMRNLRLVTHVLKEVVEPEVFSAFGGADYTDFVEKASKLLATYKGALVNLLVVPGYKDPTFPELPGYPGFVERYVEGEEPKLRMPKPKGKAAPKKDDGIDLPF